MIKAQRIVAGFPFPLFINETAAKQRIAPGVFIDETIAGSLRLNSNLNGLSASGRFFAGRIDS